MSYIIFVLIFLAVCLFVLSYKNKYIFFLGFMIISITGILFSMLNFIFKTGYYSYTTSFWGMMDYDFYLKLSKFRLEYYSIVKMFNVSVALYMLSVVAFMFFYFRSVFELKKTKFYALSLVLFLFPLYTIWFYAPGTSNMMYTTMYEDVSGIIRCVVLFADMMNYIIMFG